LCALRFIETFDDTISLQPGEPIDPKDSIELIDLVLETYGEQTIGLFDLFHTALHHLLRSAIILTFEIGPNSAPAAVPIHKSDPFAAFSHGNVSVIGAIQSLIDGYPPIRSLSGRWRDVTIGFALRDLGTNARHKKLQSVTGRGKLSFPDPLRENPSACARPS
jgi:hypothetical protein